MKNLSLFIAGLLPCFYAAAQSTVPLNNTSTYIHCTKFYVSKPMRDLPDYKPAPGSVRKEAADKRRRTMRPRHISVAPELQNDYSDPLRQTDAGSKIGSDAPKVDFEGTTDSLWYPGDPNGAVGPNDYVQALNVTYTVFDKTGKTLLAAKDLGSLWSGDPQYGDPVVLYDKFADRWFISEFLTPLISPPPCKFCVAVSKTNDPTGAYYVWQFSMGNIMPDYPKYSIWSDGYYITFNEFDNTTTNGPPVTPEQVAVLERNRMLKGDANAGMILANVPTPPDFFGGNNSLFSDPKIFDCDASALPPFGTPDYLVFFENIASGGYSNSIVMYKLVTDTTAKTLTVSRADSFAVPTFNAYFSGGNFTDISQPGYPNGVDALDGTFNFRVPYEVFTGYNSVVLSNTVNLGGSVAGIRWYELRQVGGVWSVYQDGTYGPSDGTSRWNGAICQDEDGDIALEYSVSSSTVYPGIRYTGRLSTDKIGTMTFAEQTAINGTYSLNPGNAGVGGRWGDYSQLDIDPTDGLTFWGTNQYGASPDGYSQFNRIFSFKLAAPTGIDEISDQTSLKVYQQANYLEVTASGLPTDDKLSLDLFDISGRQLSSQTVVPNSGQFEANINVSSFAKGIYFVRIGRVNFQRVVKVAVN